MIRKENCVFLGNITKPHGIKGSVLLWLKNIKAEEIKERNSVFVEIDGLLVPFFIDKFQINSSETIIITFEGVSSVKQAMLFAGNNVYAESSQIKKNRKSLQNLPSLEGYKVIDSKKGIIGLAGKINEIVNNPLLEVIEGKKVFLIPFHEDIVTDINDVTREISIEMPEGLMDI